MKIILIAMTFCLFSCTSSNSKKEGVDVDGIACGWNKTSDEQKEQCKKDPNKKTVGERLDTQLSKDAKTIKEFFGIKSSSEQSQE